ncbi:MAG: hypothetical protein HFJ30_00240 [Clostridia bacterium]|jgi:hypothetical protein|nr:hypothetical protein [Clostridia bacterium]
MNSIFDLIFNASDFVEDQLIINELTVEINKMSFNMIMKVQEMLIDQYGKLKTDMYKKALKEGIDNGFIQLLKVEEQLKQAKKDLKETKKQARKIL